MRKIKLIEPGKLILENTSEQFGVTDSTVKVEVKACGICGSDLALYTGRRDLAGEHYFGHEFSGTIIDEGRGLNGMHRGMRVASELIKGCGRCWFCRNGLQNYCKSLNDALLPGGFTEETLAQLEEKIRYIDRTTLLPSLEIDGMGLMNIDIRFRTFYKGKHIFSRFKGVH